MGSTINWGKLVAQNRVKAHGIPWNDEELKAIHEYKIDPEDVRAGILTPDDKKNQDKQPALRYMKLKDLIKRAKDLGLEFEESSVTRGDLILEIETAEEKRDNASKNPKSTGSLPSETDKQGNEGPNA